MYYKPYNLENFKKYINKYYPDKADELLKDPVHLWRAKTGIELIHKEPTKKEQMRIWKNWKMMPVKLKKKSDEKSKKLFGKDNVAHHEEIIKFWK